MPSSYSSLFDHLIWSTKHRKRQISKDWRDDLYAYIGGILRNSGCKLIVIGGIENHIHLLILGKRDVSVHDLVRDIKTNSSKWVHEKLAKDFAWQTGYCAISVSPSETSRVKRYIETQEEHHGKRTYEEEVIALLDACGIEYDPKYLFD